jgi:hypothetical protein
MSDVEQIKQSTRDIAAVWLQALPAGRYAADKRARAVLEQFIAEGEAAEPERAQ